MNRRALTLVELLVSLVLAGVVLAAFGRSLSVQRRAEARTASAQRRAVAAGEAVRVSTAALSRLAAGDSVWMRGDTAIEWRAMFAVGLACVAGGDSLVMPDSGASVWWESDPDSGDGIDVIDADGRVSAHELVVVNTRAAGACGGANRVLRLRGSHGATGPVAVRATRRIRLVLYRGGDGDWWLGERRCPYEGALRCSSTQPIAGPLDRSPQGLAFAIESVGRRSMISVVATSGGVRRTGAVGVRQ